MRMFRDLPTVYLHRDVVDVRKSIDGLSAIVEQQMDLDPFADALYVFCNRHRDRLKVLYSDQTSFCLSLGQALGAGKVPVAAQICRWSHSLGRALVQLGACASRGASCLCTPA